MPDTTGRMRAVRKLRDLERTLDRFDHELRTAAEDDDDTEDHNI